MCHRTCEWRGPLYEQRFVDTLRDSSLQILYLIYSHSISFTNIILSWKHKYKQTFAIATACSVIVTNSEQLIRVFSLINTADSIYVPWFRQPRSQGFSFEGGRGPSHLQGKSPGNEVVVQAHSCGYVVELINVCNQIIAVPKAKAIQNRLR